MFGSTPWYSVFKKPSLAKDDGETVNLNAAKTLGINLRPAHIQYAHRLGKKKNIEKPRPIIVRFVSNKKEE